MYCILLAIMALITWFFTPARDIRPVADRPMLEMLEPLRYIRDVYGLDLKYAVLATTLFIFPASLLRPVGGYLSDKFGARRMMYWVFGLILAATFFLSLPRGKIILDTPININPSGQREVFQFAMSVTWFTILVFIVGICMGIGKAAVYKYIPENFPRDVGAVGGLVGMLGALGVFFLPPLFAVLFEWTLIPQSTFFLMFLVTAFSLGWLQLTVMSLLQKASPALEDRLDFHDASETAST